MRFLSTLFWVLLAVICALFSFRNWTDVTLNLWGDIQADVKVPILLLIMFLIGFLPTWLIMRARGWSHKRRVEALERRHAETIAEPPPVTEETEPVI
jgi:uncharacterized integral membrane protein